MAAIKASILRNWTAWLCAGAAFGFIAFVVVGSAYAADKNGVAAASSDGLADLEGRIAELEATVARKGNRKVTLKVYGQIAKSMTYISWGSYQHTQVTENGNDEAQSFVGFAGEARVSPNLKVGFVAEIGIGSYDASGVGYGPFGGDTNGIYTRQSFVWFGDVDKYGKLSLGKTEQATHGLLKPKLANTAVAETKLSLEPLVGPSVGTVLNLYDGNYANVVRYDSPAFAGFALAASWGSAVDLTGSPTDQASVWDVALRYNHEFGQFQVAGSAGYRSGVVVPTVFNVSDVKTWTVGGELKHTPTGVFVNGAYGSLDASSLFAGLPNITAWNVQGGVEERLNSLGKTTVFLSYSEFDLPGSTKPTIMGIGVVQAVDAAAADFYATYHQIDTDGFLTKDKVGEAMVGARIKF